MKERYRLQFSNLIQRWSRRRESLTSNPPMSLRLRNMHRAAALALPRLQPKVLNIRLHGIQRLQQFRVRQYTPSHCCSLRVQMRQTCHLVYIRRLRARAGHGHLLVLRAHAPIATHPTRLRTLQRIQTTQDIADRRLIHNHAPSTNKHLAAGLEGSTHLGRAALCRRGRYTHSAPTAAHLLQVGCDLSHLICAH